MEAASRIEKRKYKLELSKRKDSVMDHSIYVETKILEVAKLLDRPDLDIDARANYMSSIDRLTKKQKMLDEKLDKIWTQMEE